MLGLKGLVVKGHGSSTHGEIKNAIHSVCNIYGTEDE